MDKLERRDLISPFYIQAMHQSVAVSRESPQSQVRRNFLACNSETAPTSWYNKHSWKLALCFSVPFNARMRIDRGFLNVMILSWGFMLVFTAFQTMGNIQVMFWTLVLHIVVASATCMFWFLLRLGLAYAIRCKLTLFLLILPLQLVCIEISRFCNSVNW